MLPGCAAIFDFAPLAMAASSIQWREPESFVSGDTLLFQRSLPDFLPADGWAIRLTVTQNLPNAAKKVADVLSAPDSTNNYHVFNVPNFLAGVAAGTYVLAEEIINAAGNAALNPPVAAGTKQQISVQPYFLVQDDLADGLGTAPVISQNQQDLTAAYGLRSSMLQFRFAETEDLRSRFSEKKLSDVNNLISELEEKVIWEKRAARAANGQPDGSTTEPVLRIFA